MRRTVAGRTVRVGYPGLVLGALVLAFLLVLAAAGLTSGAAFGAYNADWTGTAELRRVADASDRTVVVGGNGTGPESVDPGRTTMLVLGGGNATVPGGDGTADFVRRGGTLIVAGDVPADGNPLLATVGADARLRDAPLRDPRAYHRSPAFPVVRSSSNASRTAGVDQFTLNHGTALAPNGATVLARTSSFAYVDANRNGRVDPSETLGGRPVLTAEPVGNGTVIVLGDSSAFVNAMLDRDGNRALLTALLAGADTVVIRYPGDRPLPALAHAVLRLRRAPALQGAVVLGAVVLLSLGLRRRWPASADGRDAPRTGAANHSRTAAGATDEAAGLARTLERRHPDWEPARIERLVRAAREAGGDDDGD